jgi:hypothetical protein
MPTTTPPESAAPLSATEKAPLPEADKRALPEAQKTDLPTKEAGILPPGPLKGPSEKDPSKLDKDAEKPATVTLKQSEKTNEDLSKTDDEKSFFAKSRDFVVNLFKRS